ncbi:MAG: hypothetical protein JWM42_4060 [Burkholderia sp.]|nr:hypothetical protein [Burkholderia sp.]
MNKMKLSLLALVSSVLAACGGGGGASPTPLSGPKFGDCFIGTPGTRYTKTNGYSTLIVQEPFNGRAEVGEIELRSDGKRDFATYVAVGSTEVDIRGFIFYDASGEVSSTEVTAGYNAPVNLAPGQKIQRVVTVTKSTPTQTNPPTTRNEELTFIGFENLTLGGRTFTDVCKFVMTGSGGEKVENWFAKGFGNIKWVTVNASGTPIVSAELQTILAAP